jgi:hypothetical protein
MKGGRSALVARVRERDGGENAPLEYYPAPDRRFDRTRDGNTSFGHGSKASEEEDEEKRKDGPCGLSTGEGGRRGTHGER